MPRGGGRWDIDQKAAAFLHMTVSKVFWSAQVRGLGGGGGGGCRTAWRWHGIHRTSMAQRSGGVLLQLVPNKAFEEHAGPPLGPPPRNLLLLLLQLQQGKSGHRPKVKQAVLRSEELPDGLASTVLFFGSDYD